MAERTGQQFGNYRLVSLLGQGGFAEVYLGEHTGMPPRVVVPWHTRDTKVISMRLPGRPMANILPLAPGTRRSRSGR
nr:hypothetical protein [Ktedonobacter racemifer]